MILGGALALVIGFSAAELDGKTVFVSPGHGFYFHPTLGWITQRGTSETIVEDLENADTVFAFLAEYLRRAGADVWPCRCECSSAVEVIVDDAGPGYEETGAWRPTSSAGYGGSARFASVAPGSSASARFRPRIPESGRYPVYVWFVAGTNRAADTLVRITHAAGTDQLRITQQRDGQTWRYVGAYFFFAGDGQTVEIAADGADTSKVVIADAIRIGGGLGSIESNDGSGAPSGRPRYEECSVYWARYQGAPATVYDASTDNDGSDDVTCRPRYAEFEREGPEDALYISYHTNAGGGTGTETFRYTGGGTDGSTLLRDLLQEEVVRDVRQAWDPAWADRGVKEANFGELRLLGTMPGALIETAFHDNPTDLAAERSPRWRKIVSRAIYQAVARYFGGDGATLLPEPPERVTARASGAGTVRVAWRAGLSGTQACGAGAAARYRVALSRDGLDFAVARETASTSASLSGLPAGVPLFFRITAVNNGGESLPSATAAVVLPAAESGVRILLAHACQNDEGVLRRMTRPTETLGDVLRLEPGRSPGGRDAAFEHAWALHAARPEAALDFAQRDALGDFALDAYDAIALVFGEESESVLPEAAAGLLVAFVDGGGALIASGSAAAGWISQSGGAQARALLARLGTAFVAAKTAPAVLVPRGELASVGAVAIGATTDWRRSGAATYEQVRALTGASAVIDAGGVTTAVAVPGKGIFCGCALEAVPLGAFRMAFYAHGLDIGLGPAALQAPSLALESGSATPVIVAGSVVVELRAEGVSDARFVWSIDAGPAGGATVAADAWEVAREGFGYGDDDDVSVTPEAARQCPTVLVRREFTLDDPALVASLVLDIRYDDGVVAYLNGHEAARRNVAPGAGRDAWALTSIEPLREEIELIDTAAPLLAAGRNVLALSFHNANATSSDLTASATLRAVVPGRGHEFLIAPGALWHVRTCGQNADAAWHAPSFDAAGGAASVRFTRPGTYVVAVRAETPERESPLATMTFEVKPEGARAFVRGDGNGDGHVDVADAISVLSYLFASGRASCLSAMDANASRKVDIADAIFLLQYLFTHAAPPPAPGPEECGFAPEEDGLGCDKAAARCE